jgi:predicted alpha/beta superfamily hydrolase
MPPTWHSYTEQVNQHTVVGDLRVLRGLHSPQLDNHRDILVWLPPDYADSPRRYPVVYMHDAQNLFDAHTSYVGEWQVDETMLALTAEGYATIIVGLPNMNEHRRIEYSPYDYMMQGQRVIGQGDLYVRFITETVKPLIDATFRTLPDNTHTGIAGSSMGGLISLYGFLMYPTIFGFCGAFSTAYWFGGDSLLKTTQQHATGSGRVYLDVGTREGETLRFWTPDSPDLDADYVQGVRQLRDALQHNGYSDASLLYVEAEGAAHNEGAWAARLPAALRFLLPK